MNCVACGGDNREGAHFCRHCGQPLTAPAAADQPVAGVTAEVPLLEPGLAAPPIEAAAGSLADEATGAPKVETTLELQLPAAPAQESVPAAAEPGASAAPATAVEAAQPVADGGPAGGEIAAEPQAPGEAPSAAEEGPAEVPEPVTPAAGEEAAAPLVPLPPGTVIAARYLLLEPRAVQAADILYDARDLCRCWQCGFAGNAPDDAFCAQCGASLDRKATVRLLEVRDDQSVPPGGEPVAERLAHEGHTLLLLAEPQPEPAAPAEGGQAVSSAGLGLRLVVGQSSDVGRARELNEDSLLALTLAPTYQSRPTPVLGLFAVADGMGGQEGGEVASKLALQVMAEQAIRGILLPTIAGDRLEETDLTTRLSQAVLAANDAVYLARQKRGNDMGTTLTAACIRDDRLFLAHVGDSRAYRWDAGGLRQLTTDHSVVASMVAAGRIAPGEIYTHPQRNVIYRNIGDRPAVDIDASVLPLQPGDRIVLCSDGLWEMIRDEGIQDGLMQEANPQAACDLLVKRANAAGGEDNISVIVVQLEALP